MLFYYWSFKGEQTSMCSYFSISNKRRIQDRRAATPPPLKKLGFVFVNFDNYTQFYFDCSQHTMFTICILFIILTTKTYIGYIMWRGIKTNPRPKNSTAPGPRPPVSKFLDPSLQKQSLLHIYNTRSHKKITNRWGGGEPVWECLVMTLMAGSKYIL